MAVNKKISGLVAAGALTGAELVPVVQGGTTVKTTAQDIANLLALGTAVIGPGTTNITKTAHLGRALSCNEPASTSVVFAATAVSGALDGDGFECLITGAGTQTASGAITAATGYKLTAGTGEVLSAIYDSTADAFFSTTPDIASLGTGTVTHTGSLTANAVVLGNGTADIKPMASLGTTTTVLHGNAAGAPTFGAVSLTADVSGVLPIANMATGTPDGTKFVRDDGTLAVPSGSGTVTHTAGALTASALMVGNGSADAKVLASLGTTTTVLHGNAAGLPTFGAVSLTADVSGVLPVANFATGTPNGSKFVRDDGVLATPPGTGDVVGPASVTDGRLALFDGTTGKLIKQGNAPPTGTNTGDQTITLTGDVTGSGTGSFAATIANDAVTYAKMQNVSATDKVLGRSTAGSGDVEEISTTGSGNVVRATSATLVTPALGTPSALVLTNATGLPVAGGGTGAATFTAYSVVCAGTTSTGAFQNVSGLGTANYVLTSNGAGALPTWQAAAAGSTLLTQNSKSAAYTTVLGDAGYHIFHPSADTTARTWTIDSNANVAYSIGTVITFVNQNAAGIITIAITSDTMRLAGAGTTGSRTLAANGVATALKVTSTEWIISGTGLS